MKVDRHTPRDFRIFKHHINMDKRTRDVSRGTPESPRIVQPLMHGLIPKSTMPASWDDYRDVAERLGYRAKRKYGGVVVDGKGYYREKGRKALYHKLMEEV